MARIKFTAPEPRTVPWLNGRLVLPGEVVEVPDAQVAAYTDQVEVWQAVKPAAVKEK